MRAPSVAWMTAAETLAAVGTGDVPPVEVVAAHLQRIARHDPALGAYVHVDGGAAPGRGALAGLTLAVKDTRPVRGKPWTYGSPRWRDRVAEEDELAVARARSLGVAVLGKTNTPELAAAVGTTNEL